MTLLSMLKILMDKGAPVELAELLVELADSVREISQAIVMTDTGKVGTHNAFGEEQAAMDVKSEEILQAHMKTCPFVGAFSSEEMDQLEVVRDDGKYSVYYDPLDGSSLLDVNFAVGTIVGVYEGNDVIGQTPADQVAAAYGLYGPRTTFMLTFGKGTMEFTLHEGAWELSEESVKLKNDKKYFAPGNLRSCNVNPAYYDLIQSYIEDEYTLRYSGGMVPDLNHIFKKGSGIFMYPGTPDNPDAKLRLLFECAPMAMLMEQAGGFASDGKISMMDKKIESLVQRTPIFIGGREQVEAAVKALV
jgi:fructose-1,6-bisphosphatase I